ncbi:hypothetical protein GFK91_24435 [Roseibium aggregatum]|uniref:DUF6236 family protein n=1 Tax=Roseibium aggregatum TaxID=187304 RepID=UPI001E471447|nr:DUF6236 family protein [Roseibium aggregatum]UES58499.1 hypothetical protein GFK91_24435 [Roseibium aggregatum]
MENKRGLIVTSPMEIDGTKLYLRDSELHPHEIRTAVLFWDHIVSPKNAIFDFELGADAEFLTSAGILERPEYFFPGDQAQATLKGVLKAFNDLEKQHPGQWAIAQGENGLLVAGGAELFQNRGLQVSLHKAIPVPDFDVPLEELLRFKENRKTELQRLRLELDQLYFKVHEATDQPLMLNSVLSEIDLACHDLLKVGSESRIKMMLSDWKMSLNVNLKTTWPVLAGIIATQFGMPKVEGLLAGAAGALAGIISFKRDFALGNDTSRSSPYRYIQSYYRDLLISTGK